MLVKGECDFGTDAECLAKNVVQQNAGYMAGTLVGIREVTSALQGFYGYTEIGWYPRLCRAIKLDGAGGARRGG